MRKWIDIKFKKSKTVILASLVSAIFAFSLGAFMIWARSPQAGIGIIVFWFFFYFSHVIFYVYRQNKGLPLIWRRVTSIIVIVVCCSSLLVSWILESFNDFLGFSISFLVIDALTMGYSFFLLKS